MRDDAALILKSAQKNGVADTISYANLEHHPQDSGN